MTATKLPKSKKAVAPRSRTLKSLATKKGGLLSPRDTVASASKRMRKLHAKSLPVAEDRKLIGTVEERDPDLELTGKGHDPCSWHVSEIMKRDIVFCFEDEDCTHAQQVMAQHDLRYLPVVDRELRIVGIVNRREVGQLTARR